MVSRRFNLLVFSIAAFFAALYATEGWMFKNYNLDMFAVATGYLKDCDDTLYPKDFIWSKANMIRNVHVNIRRLMCVTDTLTIGMVREPVDLFLLWLPVCFLLFFAGNYLLALRFSGDQGAALLVACSFMLVRRAIWDWWGIGPAFTMSARGSVLCLLPLTFWAFLACEGKLRRLGGFSFLWGLVCNLHALSGWGFVEFLAVTVLVTERFHPRAWAKVMVMICAMMLGSVPFLLVWRQVVVVPESLQADTSVVKQFLSYYHFIQPSTPEYLIAFLQDIAIPLGLAIVGGGVWRRSRCPEEIGNMKIPIFFPWIVIGMIILVIIGGVALQQMGMVVPVVASEHARNIKMIYLVLPIWMGFAFAWWLRSNHRPFLKWGAPILIVFLSLAINFPGHKFARYSAYHAKWLPQASAKKIEADLREDAADLEVALWARNHTPKQALFYFDSYEFRYYSHRSLVFCWWDSIIVVYHSTYELEEWLRRRDRLQPLKLAGDGRGMLALAREYGADYLVVLKSWKPLALVPVWSNAKYAVYRVRD